MLVPMSMTAVRIHPVRAPASRIRRSRPAADHGAGPQSTSVAAPAHTRVAVPVPSALPT